MSSNLYWIQTAVPSNHALSDELKFALRKEYGEPVRLNLDESDLSYLRGLFHAGLKDAEKLIKAIHKHGEIRVFEDFG